MPIFEESEVKKQMAASKVERTEEEKAESKKRQVANLKPFRKLSELTEEERAEQLAIMEKGKIASREHNHKKATMNQLAKSLLQQSVSRAQVEKMIGEDASLICDDELTVAQVLNVVMVQESLKGNVLAYREVRDTAGFSPKQQIEVTADVMTDSDRELIEKLKSRLNTINAT